jgi:DNA-binding transcriptional MerR regulator
MARPMRHNKSDPDTAKDEASDPDIRYTIGELADEFGITTRTIRFYESRGLISPERKGANRSYSRRNRARLMLILRGKNLGFTLEDIAEYLSLYDADPGQLAQTKMLLGKVESMIEDLIRKRADIDRTLRDLKELRAKCHEYLRGGGAQKVE